MDNIPFGPFESHSGGTIAATIAPPGEAFRHGYLFAIGVPGISSGEGWLNQASADGLFATHPTTSFHRAEGPSKRSQVVVVGEPIDVPRGEANGPVIANSLRDELERNGRDAAIRYAAYLGGRFVVFLRDSEGYAVVPDCISSVPAYWMESAGGVLISSHPSLLAESAPEVPLDEDVLGLMRLAKQMETGGTLYIPAPRTTRAGVRPLLANHVLEIGDRDHKWNPIHRRFYPFETGPVLSSEAAYGQFSLLLREHCRLLIRNRPVGISLTGGLDSRMTLYASRPHLKRGSFAWTWNHFAKPQEAMVEDLLEANRQAFRTETPHRIVDVKPSNPPDHWFSRAYSRTFDPWKQHPTLAFAAATQLPRDIDHFLSMVAEVGTGFYRSRDNQEPTPERLASLYCRFPFGRLPEVQAIHEEYIEYSQMYPEVLHGFDYHDIFYWEARIGRWGVQRMQELDLAHRVQLPFNQRGIVEALQAFSLEDRFSKAPFVRLIADLESGA